MAIYNIPLRSKVIKVQRYRRAKKAVSVVRAFVERHQKSTKVKLGKYLNETLWKEGIRNFPRIVRVGAEKNEKGVVNVELLDVPREKLKDAEKTIETVAGEKREEKAGELPNSKEKLKQEEQTQKNESSEKKPQEQKNQQKKEQTQKNEPSEKKPQEQKNQQKKEQTQKSKPSEKKPQEQKNQQKAKEKADSKSNVKK